MRPCKEQPSRGGRENQAIELGGSWTLYVLWSVASLSLVVRVVIASLSEGSNDVRTWLRFSHHISERGLVQTYRDLPLFNHPPLMGLLGWLSFETSNLLYVDFSAMFKVTAILADVLTAYLLWLVWRKKGPIKAAKVVTLFSINLVSILVSSYHGNTDCLCAMLCLACAYALSQTSWAWAGLALGAAINVKLVPLMLIPVFVLTLPSRQALFRFVLPLILGALPFLPVMFSAWPEFRRNALDYNSLPFNWGIPLIWQEAHSTLPSVSTWLKDHYVPHARYLILGAMVGVGLLQRWRQRLNIFEVGTLAVSLFLVLSPGLGVQYLVWLVPLFFAASPRRATKYALLGGIFAALVYYLYWTGGRPWFSNFRVWFPPPSHLLGLLTWVLLIQYSMIYLKKLLRPSAVVRLSDPNGTCTAAAPHSVTCSD